MANWRKELPPMMKERLASIGDVGPEGKYVMRELEGMALVPMGLALLRTAGLLWRGLGRMPPEGDRVPGSYANLHSRCPGTALQGALQHTGGM